MTAIQLTLAQAYFNPRIRRENVDDNEVFCAVDLMAEFTDLESRPSVLWQRTKKRLAQDGFDVYQRVIPISVMDKTGRRKQKTDFIDIPTLMRVLQSIPSRNVEPIREWLASLGYREMVEAANPELAVQRRRAELKKLTDAGYGNHPDVQRLRDRDTNIEVFKSLKSTIAKVCDNPKWGGIFNAEYMAMFGEVASQLELTLKSKSIRDALPSLQLLALTYAERTLQAILANQDNLSSDDVIYAVHEAIAPIGLHLRQTCQTLGIHHITGLPLLGSGQ